MTLAAGVLFVVIHAPLACSSHKPGAFGNRELSWGVRAGNEPVPGIDRAEVDLGTWGDGAAIAVWSDAASSFGASGMGGRELEAGEARKGVKYEGKIQASDGKSWTLECYSPDGKTGQVRIGNLSFALAEGGLFLVSTSRPDLKVKQMNLARLDLKPEGALAAEQLTVKSLKELARTDTDIRAFFTEAARPR